MFVRTTVQARSLGLLHPRVWRLSAAQPLLSAQGLTAEEVHSSYDPDQPIPAGYRKLLSELGYASVVPAGERLRELVATRGWKSHGAVVDAVSVATLRHGAGIGLHRLPAADDDRELVITRAEGGDRITPAFSSKTMPIPSGDLIYGLAEGGSPLEPFAWLGKRDCDSADHQLSETDQDALLVVLGCPDEDAAHSEEIGASVAELLAKARLDVTMTPLPHSP